MLRILSGKNERGELDARTSDLISDNQSVFDPQERLMIARVLGMAQRNVESIMTSRHDVDYLDINKSSAELIELMEKIHIHVLLLLMKPSAMTRLVSCMS